MNRSVMENTNQEPHILSVFAPPEHLIYQPERIRVYKETMDQLAQSGPVEAGLLLDCLGRVAERMLATSCERMASAEQILGWMAITGENPTKIFHWAQQAGVIREKETSLYQFTTDQLGDYLAARYLASRPENSWAFPKPYQTEGLEGLLPLLVAYRALIQGDCKRATQLVLGLPEAEMEERFHTSLLYQGLCLAEGEVVEADAADKIITSLLEQWSSLTPSTLQRWLSTIFSALCAMQSPMGERARKSVYNLFSKIIAETACVELENREQAKSASISDELFMAWLAQVYGEDDFTPPPWEETEPQVSSTAGGLGTNPLEPSSATPATHLPLTAPPHHTSQSPTAQTEGASQVTEPLAIKPCSGDIPPAEALRLCREALYNVCVALCHGVNSAAGLMGNLADKIPSDIRTGTPGMMTIVLNLAVGETGIGGEEAGKFLRTHIYRYCSEPAQEMEAIAISAIQSLGTGTITPEQIEKILGKCLTNPATSSYVKIAAALALPGLNPIDGNLKGILLNLLEHDNILVAEAASQALESMVVPGDKLPGWVEKDLGAENKRKRARASIVAARFGSRDDRIPRVLLSSLGYFLQVGDDEHAKIHSVRNPKHGIFAHTQTHHSPYDGGMEEAAEAAGLFAQLLADLAENREDTREVLLAALSKGKGPLFEGAAISMAVVAFNETDRLAGLRPGVESRQYQSWKKATAAEALRRLDEEDDPMWSELVWTAAVLGRDEGGVEVALLNQEKKQNLDDFRKAELASALAVTGQQNPETYQYLKRCIGSSDANLMLAAIQALGELPDNNITIEREQWLKPTMEQILDTTGDPVTQQETYTALFRLSRLP